MLRLPGANNNNNNIAAKPTIADGEIEDLHQFTQQEVHHHQQVQSPQLSHHSVLASSKLTRGVTPKASRKAKVKWPARVARRHGLEQS